MSSAISPFIGRAQELALVDDLIQAPNGTRRVVFFTGSGGIGKTWLLREIYARCSNARTRLGVDLAYTRVGDLDDLAVRLLPNLERLWMEDLGEEWFSQSKEFLRAYHQPQTTLTDADWLQETDHRRLERFIADVNQLAHHKRLLFLLDTVERVRANSQWHTFVEIITQVENAVWVLAGRNLDAVANNMAESLGKEVVHCHLMTPFSETEAQEYFLNSDVGQALDNAMREKLVLLSARRPVLLALATEWLRRDMPIDSVTSRPLDELRACSNKELETYRQLFEQILVNKIFDLTELDQTFLLMALANRRFDAAILAMLQGISIDQSQALIDRAKQFGFVKPLAQANFVLHDEVQQLVTNYSWPRMDPGGTLRQDYGKRLVEYYAQHIATLEQALAQQQTLLRQSPSESLRREIEIQQNHIRVWQAEQFYYLLEFNQMQAYEQFKTLFDQATHNYEYDFRALLWQQIDAKSELYTGQAAFELAIRGVKYLLDASQFDQAYEHASKLSKSSRNRTLDQRLDLLTQLANIQVRRGKTPEALDHLNRAIQLLEQQSKRLASQPRSKERRNERARNDEWFGRMYSTRGWVLRLQGQWADAARAYEKALTYSRRVKDDTRIAQLLNNLGYVRALLGDRQTGLDLCKQALTIWEKLGRQRWIAATHNTIAGILTMLENYDAALEYYDRTLRVFKDQADWDWVTVALSEKAFCRWQSASGKNPRRLALIEESLDEVNQAYDICQQHHVRRELPALLHRRGHIHLSLNHLDQAESDFHASLQEAEKAQDNYRIVDNLLAFAEVALRRSQSPAEIGNFVLQIEKKIKADNLHFALLEGRAYRVLGDAFFAVGNYDIALEEYTRALPRIAEHGGFGDYRLSKELEDLGAKFTQLDRGKAIYWLRTFRREWSKSKSKLQGRHEVLTAFCDVQATLLDN